MKKLLLATTVAALLMPAGAVAQSVFNGTWKFDVNNMNFPKKPDVILLQDGMYTCNTCDPPFTIKADGKDQPVVGNPYADTIAVQVVNDREVKFADKKNGKLVSTESLAVSADGNAMSDGISDSSSTNGGPPVMSKSEFTRVANGPTRSHAISGSWRMTKIESVSDNGATFTYKVVGDELTMTNMMGQTYTAKFNGTEAPEKGDPGTTSVKLKLINKNTFEETDFRNGKLIGVWRMTVSPDGKTGNVTFHDARQNTTTTARVIKQ